MVASPWKEAGFLIRGSDVVFKEADKIKNFAKELTKNEPFGFHSFFTGQRQIFQSFFGGRGADKIVKEK